MRAMKQAFLYCPKLILILPEVQSFFSLLQINDAAAVHFPCANDWLHLRIPSVIFENARLEELQ